MADSELQKIKYILSKINIHVIPYCHADYAWTHPRCWHVSRYKQVIDEVLDIMDKNPSYRWMADNIMHILLPYYECPGNRFTELTGRINEGRIEIANGIMSLLRPTTAGAETFIRNIIYGRKWMKENGIEINPGVFHNVDVSFGHSQLPQLLKLSGFSYYRGWRPQGALDAKKVPREFIWQGTDRSEIACSRGTYAGLWEIDYLNESSFSDDDGTLVRFYNTELEDIISHNETGILWLPFGMDDTRPMKDFAETPVNLDEFMKYLRLSAKAQIHYSTAAEYYKNISGNQLPMHEGVIDPCDVAYNIPTKGDKGLWHFRNQLDSLIIKAETLWVMASSENIIYPAAEFDTIWETLLFISGHAMEFAFSEDYENLFKIATNAIENVRTLIHKAVKEIASLGYNYEPEAYILVNTLEAEREGIFSISTNKTIHPGNIFVEDAEHNPVDFQIAGDTELLVDVSIPGFGINKVNIMTRAGTAELTMTNSMQKDSFEVNTGKVNVLFSNGYISQINEMQFASLSSFGNIGFTEIKPSPTDAWLYNYKHDKFHKMIVSDWQVIENGPLRWKLTVSGYAGPALVKLDIALTRNSPVIGFDITLDCHKKSNGFFTISFPIAGIPDITAGIPFGFEERSIKSEPYGKQTAIEIDNLERLWPGLFYANGWMNYNYEDADFTIIREKLPSYFWYDNTQHNISVILTRTTDLDLCTDWMKDVHSFHECLGKSNFRFSMNISKHNADFTNIYRTYREIRHCPEQLALPYIPDNAKQYKELFDIKSRYCVLSALYKDNGTTIIRLFNTSGSPDRFKIQFAHKIKSCKTVDFHQNTITRQTQETCNNYSFATALGAYEILTLAVDFER